MRSLAQQLFRTKVKFFMDIFREATKKEHGCLLLDLHPMTPDPVNVRKSIWTPDEVENLAPASERKDGIFDLDPSGYIKRLE